MFEYVGWNTINSLKTFLEHFVYLLKSVLPRSHFSLFKVS